MSKASTIKGVFRKVLECFKDVEVNFNNVKLNQNDLMGDKVCIVTGASRGIGKATVIELLNAGAVVIGLASNQNNLDKLKKELNSDRLYTLKCDLSDVSSYENTFHKILEMVDDKKITTLINCAGAKNGNDERFYEFTEEDFDYVMSVNLKAPFFWARMVAEYMIENHINGHIVNVASIKGFIGEASPYSMSKWGCVGLTKGLGRLLAGKGIVVNGVAPGGTATEMAPYKEGDSLTHFETPSLRLALPEEIAKTIVFLASDLANNIVGQVIKRDGGQSNQYSPSQHIRL